MHPHPTIVFVCEHGAAKSILAAAYFNKMANKAGLDITAIARGTNPDLELSEQTIKGLSEDGLEPTDSTPQKLSLQEVQSAQRIVSFCELPAECKEIAIVEQWHGIPAVSENYDKARDVIIERLNQFINQIRSSL